MLTEAVSFELAYRFFETLDKIKITTNLIKMIRYNGSKNFITQYASLAAMQVDLLSNYKYIDSCASSDIWYISYFECQSVLYNFTTKYTGTDIIGQYNLIYGKDSDVNRNTAYQSALNTQKSTINNLIIQYRSNFNSTNAVYLSGLYSPCYAEAGYSEGSGYLADMKIRVKDYRNVFTI